MPMILKVGRKEGNDIVISSPYLSSSHASLEALDLAGLLFKITDLGSTNGTTVNGRQVIEEEFTLGDSVKLGEYELRPSDFLYSFANITPVGRKGRRGSTVSGWALMASLLLGGLLGSVGSLAEGNMALIERVFLLMGGLASVGGLVALGFYLYRLWNRVKADELYYRSRQDGLLESIETDLKRRNVKSAIRDLSWSGYRKFEVARIERECGDITSFYLSPHDKQPIPSFYPGQYLTFKLKIAGQSKPVVRCYSLSDSADQEYYRVSIKKAAPPKGSPDAPWGCSSSYFHEQVNVEDILDVKAPSGKFYLEASANEPVVLLAGGVGITPMLSMLNTLVDSKARQPIWLFYGVRYCSELVKIKHLRAIVQRYSNVQIVICCSSPQESDELGLDYDYKGRVTADLLKDSLVTNNYTYYLCGPGAFMSSLNSGLSNWGVPKEKINMETFGPSSIASPSVGESKEINGDTYTIEFSKTGKTVKASSEQSVLDVAENNGVDIEFGCRAGNCGTCLVALRSGDVDYSDSHDADIEAGSCLACIARPASNLVIDA